MIRPVPRPAVGDGVLDVPAVWGRKKRNRKRFRGGPPDTRKNITHEEDTSYRNG